MHNLVQFALNCYHVPVLFQELIFDYYEKLCAKVTTKEWPTGFFFFYIGLFQGCVLNAKPVRCISFALRQFRTGATSSKGYVPLHDTIYSAYDPMLLIDGEPLMFIENIKTERKRHFKFLGRWISADLNDEAPKRDFATEFFGWLALVDKDLINGLMKLWVYQHYIISSPLGPC